MDNQAGEVIELMGAGVGSRGGSPPAAKVTGLPPGFRFHPTDEELLVQYLRKKAHSRPLPADVIPEIELYKFEPWDLPLGVGGGNQKVRYFFNLREPKYPNGAGGRANRAAGSGYWKATGRDRMVMGSRDQLVAGWKKVLVFYRGKPPTGTRTDWVMHEYRLPPASPLPPAVPLGGVGKKAAPLPPLAVPNPAGRAPAATTTAPSQDWVLCRVFKKKKAGAARGREDMEDESDEEEMEGGQTTTAAFAPPLPPRPSFIDFLGPPRGATAAAVNPAASGSESSCVTEASASEEVESGAEVGGGRRHLLP